jgi:hypothetical protein
MTIDVDLRMRTMVPFPSAGCPSDVIRSRQLISVSPHPALKEAMGK